MMDYKHVSALIERNQSKALAPFTEKEVIFRLIKTQAVGLIDHKFPHAGSVQGEINSSCVYRDTTIDLMFSACKCFEVPRETWK